MTEGKTFYHAFFNRAAQTQWKVHIMRIILSIVVRISCSLTPVERILHGQLLTAIVGCLVDIDAIHTLLGIPSDYGQHPFRPGFPEAKRLVAVGVDIFGRPQKLAPEAAQAWSQMRKAAHSDSIDIELVSAFRSVRYQFALFQRKLAAGHNIDHMLKTTAAPGFSQHHTGQAVDIATPECEPLTACFEETAAFRWLVTHAEDFGFSMPYPPNNRFGFIYEPWHWTHAAIGAEQC
jgi:D-alanyl-D-alanine carboxypeptidase